MSNKELYQNYLDLKLDRLISKEVFNQYIIKYGGYDNVIKFLKSKKKKADNRTGRFKKDNIQEIIGFAKIYSIEKAAKEYNISERTVYRYINK